MTAVKDEQIVQEWDDDLAVRIAPAVAAAAQLSRGQSVTVEVVQEGILVRRAIDKPKMSLEQKLMEFDPAVHGGEVMLDGDATNHFT
jgi:antitoxin MazE